MASADVKKVIDDILAEHKIVVFSKSYCPYCTKAKQALYKLIDAAKVFVLEVIKPQFSLELILSGFVD